MRRLVKTQKKAISVESKWMKAFTGFAYVYFILHPRNLISTFVIRLLESIISRLAMSEISLFYIVSVAEQAGFNLFLSETLKTGFLESWPI